MHRRTVATLLAACVVAACGGGGGGGAAAPAEAGTAAAPSAANFAGSRNIAAWGDSHTGGLPDRPDAPGYARQLQALLPDRVIYDAGIAGQTSGQIADRQVADTQRQDWVTVLWYGGNNQTQGERIKADIARSVAALAPGNRRFVVLSVTNQASPWERRGSTDYQAIVQLNADLAALYPDNYLDVRSELVRQANPADPQDAADLRDDVPPTSLRVDGVHLNVAGSGFVARRVAAFITEKGW